MTGLPQADLGAMVGRQTPILSVFVPLLPGLRRRPQARHPRRLAGRPAVWRRVRLRPVRRVQLHLGPADRHLRLAAVRRGRRAAAAGLAAGPRVRRDRRRGAGLGRRRRRHRRAHRCGGRRHHHARPAATAGRHRRPPATQRRAGRRMASAGRRPGPAGHPGRDRAGLRAVPDHHRGLRHRAAARHQAHDRQDDPDLRTGRGCTSSAPAASRPRSRSSRSTGWPPAARCCSSPA